MKRLFAVRNPVLWISLAGLLLAVWTGSPLASDPSAEGPAPKDESIPKQKLLREGRRVQRVPGRFEPAGDRFVFVVENAPRRFVVLENLNLERILKMRDVYPVPIRWIVSGEITEFRKENYLLIEQATFSSLFRKPDSEGNKRPEDDFGEKP